MLHATHNLPEWVLRLRGDRRANVALAADVANAVLALNNADLAPDVRKQMTAIIDRADQAGGGIPVSVAARVLDVTEPTVRSWTERGVLEAMAASRPLAVTPKSLGAALAAATTIRRVAGDERLLRRLLDALDDQRTRQELAGRIDELDARVPIDADRVAEELFS